MLEEDDDDVYEIFKAFIARLEVANDSDRIKVEDQMDSRGNLILPTRAIYLVDDLGILHESANTDGNRVVKSWPDGSIVEVSGTFTKTGAGGAGSVLITPAAGDEAIIMYGVITIGAVQAGGADAMTVVINDPTATPQVPLADLNMTVNQVLHIPTAFADAAVAVDSPIGTPTIHQLMIAPTHGLLVTLAGMAAAEVFDVTITFRSLTGTAPTAGPVGGTFA